MNAPDIHASQQTEPTGISRYSNPAFSAACTTRSYSSIDPGTWASGTPYAVVSPCVGRYQPNSSGRMHFSLNAASPRDFRWQQFTASVRRDNRVERHDHLLSSAGGRIG